MPDIQTELAVDSQGVARRFGARWVLRGVSLKVQPGEFVGLLGDNGSGKTTLLRILGTLLKPSAGVAKVYGHDVVTAADDVRREIGFLAHSAGLYEDLTARENLRFAAEMLGLSTAGLDEALEEVGLSHVANDRVRGFSAGMQRRLALARLALRRPRLLLLDEPYSNLDTAGIALMNSFIRRAGEAGGAAIIVLHELAPAQDVLDRTVTIRDGRVAAPSAVQLGRDAPASSMAGGDR